jgi:Fe-S cluster assembly ATPase SufC
MSGLLASGGAKEPPTLPGFEEPETGIHPERLDLVATLLENLAGDDTQVIVTTCSPTLLDLLPPESLYVVRQQNEYTTVTSPGSPQYCGTILNNGYVLRVHDRDCWNQFKRASTGRSRRICLNRN